MCGKHWTFSPALGGTFQRTTRFLWPVFLSFTWQFKHQDCSLSNGRMQQNANDNETTWLNSVYYEMTYKNSCRFFIHQLTNLLNYVDFFFLMTWKHKKKNRLEKPFSPKRTSYCRAHDEAHFIIHTIRCWSRLSTINVTYESDDQLTLNKTTRLQQQLW